MRTATNKEKFLKIYADLPLPARREIICVLGYEPMTWNSASFEIKNDTKAAKQILKILADLNII